MWKTVKLGDVCDVLDKLRKPITKKDRVSGDIPYYGATGVVDWVADFIFNEKLVLVGEDGAKWGVGDATAFIVEGKTWVNNHAHVLRPHEGTLLHEWLAYYLTAIDLAPWVTGLTVPKLNQAQLRSIPIPLPPLAEQQRIIAKLDAAFAEIDRAAELVAAKTKQAALLRQAAIDRLIENKAVASQPLRDAIEIKHGFAFRSEFFEQTGELVLLTPGNFEEEGGYRDRGEKQKYYVGECPDEFVLKGGELLVAMTEQAKGLLGSPIIVPEDGVYLHNQRLGKVQPKQPLSLAWLFHYFNTSMVRDELHRTGTGLKVRHTSPAKIGDLEIKVPSIDEQNRVAHILDNVIAEQKNLFAYYQAQTGEMSALKSAILAQELQPPQSEAA